ncbi:MAG: hypothetical protein JSU90_08990 [Nitrospiraceae bacterium]|nr:MAG: hypothetical protein JSU90_08990 [Nitrospiraceae bacterium]
MNRKMHALAYRRYLSGLVEKTTSEDNILLMAKKLVKAKDESGLNLFWDEDEETMLRVYIEHAEMIAEC